MGRAKLFVRCEFCKREMSTADEILPVRVFDGPDNRYPHYVPCCCADCANALIEKQLDDLLIRYKVIDGQKVTPISFKKYIGVGPMQTAKKNIQESHSSFSLFGGKRKQKPQKAAYNTTHPVNPDQRPAGVAAKPVIPQAKRNVPNPKQEYPYQRPQQRPMQQPTKKPQMQGQTRPAQGKPQAQAPQQRQQAANRTAVNAPQKRPAPVQMPQYPQQRPQRPTQKYPQRPQPEHTASRQPSHPNRYL